MLKTLVSVLALLAVATVATAAGPEMTTDDQKTMYALGLAISRSLGTFNLTPAELDLVKAGLTDGVQHNAPKVDIEQYGPKIQALQHARVTAAASVERKLGQAYVDKAAAEKGAVKLPSGLVITTLRAGTGATPKASDRVKVHYQGKLIDGTVFDSSLTRGQPVTFPVTGVIQCWTEGLQHMKVGGKSRFVCPADLAYGDRGAPPRIKPGATLVFEVDLIEIEK